MYSEVTGDLFELDLPAIGHGVNCRGVMGAGVAKVVRQKYPELFLHYLHRCSIHMLTPGDVLPWVATDGKVIYNLASQNEPGANATLWAVRKSVQTMLADARDRGLTRVGIPRIGAGIGGLRWADVRAMLKEEAESSTVELIVVSLPEA